jgi:hypothetical protein
MVVICVFVLRSEIVHLLITDLAFTQVVHTPMESDIQSVYVHIR